jgi:CBS domain-containing protein
MIAAKELMNAQVFTIGKEEDVYEAVRLMVLNNITGLPVVEEDGTLAGIITEKDVLPLLSEPALSGTVAEFMTTEVVCFQPEDNLREIAESFRRNQFRRVPIVRGDKLVGIVSRRDIIRYIGDLKHQDEVLKDSILEILY